MPLRSKPPLTLPRPTNPSYLYKAKVPDAIDANTRKYDIHRRYVAHVFYAFNKRGIEHTFLKWGGV